MIKHFTFIEALNPHLCVGAVMGWASFSVINNYTCHSVQFR
jgi:hypothetical protein